MISHWRCAVLLILTFLAAPRSDGEGRALEVAHGHSWVSPYWGYSAPKIVCDGSSYFTAGLWGAKPETAEGVVYCFDGTTWSESRRFPGIYQPITLVLDKAGHLIVAYTRQAEPVCLFRSKTPGAIDTWEALPSPPDMSNAYYIGLAIYGDKLFLAYLQTPEYNLYVSTLDLGTGRWSPRMLVSAGQTDQKPKTAWTYPILYPVAEGLHLVASNSPDGGEGNTYDKVWHLFFPYEADAPSVCELVAETPIGHITFATDFAVDDAGTCHILFMWNQHVYGAELPTGSPPAGTYHAWRDNDDGKWVRTHIEAVGIAGFAVLGDGLYAATVHNTLFRWAGSTMGWQPSGRLWDPAVFPGTPGFFDTISRASGSDVRRGLALVVDSLLPAGDDAAPERVLKAVLPE